MFCEWNQQHFRHLTDTVILNAVKNLAKAMIIMINVSPDIRFSKF